MAMSKTSFSTLDTSKNTTETKLMPNLSVTAKLKILMSNSKSKMFTFKRF